MTDRPPCTPAPGCACVPDLRAPADYIDSLRRVLAGEPEPVVVVTHLLRLCRDEHPTLWEHHADPRCRGRVQRRIAEFGAILPAPGTATAVASSVRARLASALTSDPDVPAVVMAHALAELIDTHYGHRFADWFRQRSPYQPAVGDPIPLDHPDLRRFTDLAPTAPPWRLANRLDETRRLRLAGAWATQFRVVFDYAAFDALDGVIDDDTVIATVHPNRDLSELGLAAPSVGPAFPVQPIDAGNQRARIDALVREATDAGASVVVLPELSVTPALAEELESWVRRPGRLRLLVAGSYHVADRGDAIRRANRAVAWVRGHHEPLTQDKHSPADRPVIEDITPPGWPEIRVHVTADGWHVVIAVCRDLLNPGAVHALAEAGANLVLAPSMTETMVPFGGPVAQLVGTGQAIVAVANNPCSWVLDGRPSSPSPARALFGHPGFAQQTRQVHTGDSEPGVAFLHLRSGRLRWEPTRSATEPSPPDREGETAPAWVPVLGRRTAPIASGAANVVARPAAILVVLTDGPEGPEALLTGRAPELTHYPEQIVFPGGATDPGDRTAADTALREAQEEVGLDPRSVHIIGALPPIGLPASGFLVTPVLGWSPELRFLHDPNPAEVLEVHHLPLRRWRQHQREGEWAPMPVGAMTAMVLDLVAAAVGAAGEPLPST